MNITILGPQGAGKGTQGRKLAKEYNLYYLETGEMLRRMALKNPEVDEAINKEGKLLPDEFVFDLITKDLSKNAPDTDGFILDGFPRSVEQYGLISNWLGSRGEKIDHVIFLNLPREEVVRRITGRRVCPSCGKIYNIYTSPQPPQKDTCWCGGVLTHRKDDTPEALEERLKEYDSTTLPLVEKLKEDGILAEFDATKSIDELFADITAYIKSK